MATIFTQFESNRAWLCDANKKAIPRDPHLVEAEKPEDVIEQFKEALHETGRPLHQERIDSIIRPKTTRVNAVNLADGWNTGF